jgi:hypothetical protein
LLEFKFRFEFYFDLQPFQNQTQMPKPSTLLYLTLHHPALQAAAAQPVQPRQPSSPRSSRPQQQAAARSTPRPAAQLAQLPTSRPSWSSGPSRRQPALLRPRAVADPRVPLVIPASTSFPRRTRPRRAPPPSPTRARVGSLGPHVEDRLPRAILVACTPGTSP